MTKTPGGAGGPDKPPGEARGVQALIAEARHAPRDARYADRIEDLLAEMETASWSAEGKPEVLNLQILLRRTYEGSVQAGKVATTGAADAATLGQQTLVAAVFVALVGWAGTIGTVVYQAWHDKAVTIAQLWPALAATSGAVLLLVGVATLALRYAQRSHDRGVEHYHDAKHSRRLEAAVRLLLMAGQQQDLAIHEALKVAALKLVDERALVGGRDAVDISSWPDGSMQAFGKLADTFAGMAKALVPGAKTRE